MVLPALEIQAESLKWENRMDKIDLKLLDQAYVNGYENAFLHEVDENGRRLITGIWNVWYEQIARDPEGNMYVVYWETREDYDPANGDESEAYDWDHPFMILDDSGKNVMSKCVLPD